MDSQRLILFFVFSVSLFLLLDAWQKDQQPAAPQATQSVPKPATPTAPAIPAPSDKLRATQEAKPSQEGSIALATGDVIKIETDILRAEVSTLGGDLRRLEFKQHRDAAGRSRNFVLFESTPERTYVAQSGLIGGELPNHITAYKANAR